MDDGFGNWAAFGDKILAKEDDKASALTMPPSAPPTAVLPTPHRPTTYKDAVLATMGGSLRAKSLVVAPLSHPSTTVDDQPQTACRCSRPRRRVGQRHGPRAPNPQEHLLHRRHHRPRAPNQSTENGWAQVDVGDFFASCSLGGTWGICCFLFFWRHLGNSVASWFLWKHFLGDNFLGGRLPSFVFLSFGSFG
jgi:hypothetical protein